MEEDRADDIEYFLLHVQREIGRDALAGLSIWSDRFAQYRNSGQFELCERLLQGIKGCVLPPHGRGVMRYSEGWLNDRMGHWQEAIAAYRASMEAFHVAGLAELDAEIWLQIGSLFQDQGVWHEAEAAYMRAQEASSTDARMRGMVLNNLGGMYMLQGRSADALGCFEEAVVLLRRAGDRHNTAAALLGIGNALRETGQAQRAQMQLFEALQEYVSLSEKREIGIVMASLALLYQTQGKFLEAQLQYEQALPILHALDRIQYVKTLGNLALVRERQGDLQGARDAQEAALDGYRTLGDSHGETVALVNLAKVCLAVQDAGQAAAYAAEARTLATERGYANEYRRLDELGL